MNAVTVSRYRHTRYWAVRDSAGDLICVCVYKRGAIEVAQRLEGATRSTGAFELHDAAPSYSDPAEMERERVRERS